VVTPACDLGRAEFRQALLVGGSLAPLTPREWTYRPNQVKTPIIILPDGRRMWIRWDLKDIQTVRREELNVWLADGGSHQILVRLRETHAIELQQRLLADLGRVGLVAQMPATFAVSVEAFTLDTDGKLRVLDLPILRREGGVCFAGRDQEAKSMSRLTLSEAAFDELVVGITGIDEDTVHQRSRETLRRLKSTSDVLASIPTPDVEKKGFSVLNRDATDAEGKAIKQAIGLIARNRVPDTDALKGDDLKNGAIVLIVRDEF
jgi:hypothetical protein